MGKAFVVASLLASATALSSLAPYAELYESHRRGSEDDIIKCLSAPRVNLFAPGELNRFTADDSYVYEIKTHTSHSIIVQYSNSAGLSCRHATFDDNGKNTMYSSSFGTSNALTELFSGCETRFTTLAPLLEFLFPVANRGEAAAMFAAIDPNLIGMSPVAATYCGNSQGDTVILSTGGPRNLFLRWAGGNAVNGSAAQPATVTLSADLFLDLHDTTKDTGLTFASNITPFVYNGLPDSAVANASAVSLPVSRPIPFKRFWPASDSYSDPMQKALREELAFDGWERNDDGLVGGSVHESTEKVASMFATFKAENAKDYRTTLMTSFPIFNYSTSNAYDFATPVFGFFPVSWETILGGFVAGESPNKISQLFWDVLTPAERALETAGPDSITYFSEVKMWPAQRNDKGEETQPPRLRVTYHSPASSGPFEFLITEQADRHNSLLVKDASETVDFSMDVQVTRPDSPVKKVSVPIRRAPKPDPKNPIDTLPLSAGNFIIPDTTASTYAEGSSRNLPLQRAAWSSEQIITTDKAARVNQLQHNFNEIGKAFWNLQPETRKSEYCAAAFSSMLAYMDRQVQIVGAKSHSGELGAGLQFEILGSILTDLTTDEYFEAFTDSRGRGDNSENDPSASNAGSVVTHINAAVAALEGVAASLNKVNTATSIMTYQLESENSPCFEFAPKDGSVQAKLAKATEAVKDIRARFEAFATNSNKHLPMILDKFLNQISANFSVGTLETIAANVNQHIAVGKKPKNAESDVPYCYTSTIDPIANAGDLPAADVLAENAPCDRSLLKVYTYIAGTSFGTAYEEYKGDHALLTVLEKVVDLAFEAKTAATVADAEADVDPASDKTADPMAALKATRATLAEFDATYAKPMTALFREVDSKVHLLLEEYGSSHIVPALNKVWAEYVAEWKDIISRHVTEEGLEYRRYANKFFYDHNIPVPVKLAGASAFPEDDVAATLKRIDGFFKPTTTDGATPEIPAEVVKELKNVLLAASQLDAAARHNRALTSHFSHGLKHLSDSILARRTDQGSDLTKTYPQLKESRATIAQVTQQAKDLTESRKALLTAVQAGWQETQAALQGPSALLGIHQTEAYLPHWDPEFDTEIYRDVVTARGIMFAMPFVLDGWDFYFPQTGTIKSFLATTLAPGLPKLHSALVQGVSPKGAPSGVVDKHLQTYKDAVKPQHRYKWLLNLDYNTQTTAEEEETNNDNAPPANDDKVNFLRRLSGLKKGPSVTTAYFPAMGWGLQFNPAQLATLERTVNTVFKQNANLPANKFLDPWAKLAPSGQTDATTQRLFDSFTKAVTVLHSVVNTIDTFYPREVYHTPAFLAVLEKKGYDLRRMEARAAIILKAVDDFLGSADGYKRIEEYRALAKSMKDAVAADESKIHPAIMTLLADYSSEIDVAVRQIARARALLVKEVEKWSAQVDPQAIPASTPLYKHKPEWNDSNYPVNEKHFSVCYKAVMATNVEKDEIDFQYCSVWLRSLKYFPDNGPIYEDARYLADANGPAVMREWTDENPESSGFFKVLLIIVGVAVVAGAAVAGFKFVSSKKGSSKEDSLGLLV